ncbi:MAG: FlgD immunoglobulin-like domain containing protein [Calditrichia bacterium]
MIRFSYLMRRLLMSVFILMSFSFFSSLHSQSSNRFGLHLQPINSFISADDEEQLTIAASAEASIIRYDVFPNPKHARYVSNWISIVEDFADEASKEGLEVMLTLRYESFPLGTTMDDYMDDIEDLFDLVGDDIKYLQLENEVYGGSSKGVWDDTGGEGYVCLLEEVSNTISTFQHPPEIVLAGIPFGLAKEDLFASFGLEFCPNSVDYDAGHDEVDFLSYTLINGHSYYDAIDLHFYGEYEDMDADFTYFIGQVDSMGLSSIKPIWVTEAGSIDLRNWDVSSQNYKMGNCISNADCISSSGPAMAYCHGELGGRGCFPIFCDPNGTREDCYTHATFYKLQAERVVKRYAILLAEEEEDSDVDIESVMWHSLHREDPDEFGSWVSLMVEGQAGSINSTALKRPAYHTFKLIAERFAGYTALSEMAEGQYKFTVGGVNHYVLWDDVSSGEPSVDLSNETGATSHVEVTHIVTALTSTGLPDLIADCKVPSDDIPVSGTPIIVKFCNQSTCPQSNCSSGGSKSGTDSPVAEFELLSNYPNPFNPGTTIRYNLPERTYVVVKIFNMIGQEIRTLVDETQTAGLQTAFWDGTNTNGESVSSGTYIYKFEVGELTQTKTMVLLK